MFGFGPPRPHRRPSLTPMIDVVFLLLIFFMLASRFGTEGALTLSAGGGGGAWSGPPRLVEIGAGTLRLNGVPVAAEDLAGALAPLMAGPADPVVLLPLKDAPVQRLVDVAEALRAAGLGTLVLAD
jgi:biopolymer transport protein ExbD